jgi:hypothetical protein
MLKWILSRRAAGREGFYRRGLALTAQCYLPLLQELIDSEGF